MNDSVLPMAMAALPVVIGVAVPLPVMMVKNDVADSAQGRSGVAWVLDEPD